LSTFQPVRRRFEFVWNDENITVISDYAHHPTEIRAVIETAHRLDRTRTVAVFQPHRYTRTRALLREFPGAFCGVDELILTPVYASSEPPLEGGRSEDLLRETRRQSRTPARLAPSLSVAWNWVWQDRRPGDLVLLLGAGDVEDLAELARRALRDPGFDADINQDT
jgi:UDP-N-acetylmuramate--alanine ligase